MVSRSSWLLSLLAAVASVAAAQEAPAAGAASLHILTPGHAAGLVGAVARENGGRPIAPGAVFPLLVAALDAPLPEDPSAHLLAGLAKIADASADAATTSAGVFGRASAALSLLVEGVDPEDALFDITVPSVSIDMGGDLYLDTVTSLFHETDYAVPVAAASVANLYATNAKSLVVSVSSDAGLAQVLGARDALLVDNAKLSVFSLDNALEAEPLVETAFSEALAREFKGEDLDAEAVKVFDVNKDEMEANFVAEITAFRHLFGAIDDDETLKKHVADKIPDYFAFGFAGIQNIRNLYGAKSKEYYQALAIVRGAISDVKEQFLALYPAGVVAVVSVPSTVVGTGLRTQLTRRAEALADTPATNWASYTDCMNATTNCFGNGNCTAQTNGTFTCICTSAQFLGPYCYREDVSAQFFIIFFLIILLVIVTYYVVIGVANVDSTNDTLLYGTSATRTKAE